MPQGVSAAKQKNGTVYYRAGITYHGKHISLGSFSDEDTAARAYKEASALLSDPSADLMQIQEGGYALSFEKTVILINFRDNQIYFKTPIYLRKGYFSYFLSPSEELKFDIDDLFYYSGRKIQKRLGHLFVSDYGMQYSIPARYGIRPYAVAGRDYRFANGDPLDYRYSNIIVINPYHGVQQIQKAGKTCYSAGIHINGVWQLGVYPSVEEAAAAYNKAADLARTAGVRKQFPANYIVNLSPKEYAELYTKTALSEKYLADLERAAFS